MTTARVDWASAQARLQARHGARPDDALWRTLEASRTAAHALALTRATPLADWTDGLADAADAHRVEPHLRARWQRRVDAVARWAPPAWRSAVRAFAGIAELPRRDAADARAAALQWLRDWQRLWPADAGDAALLRRPALLLLPRLAGDAASATAMRGDADAPALRRALARLQRRHAFGPVALFAHLALLALDVERLRGLLAVRALFEPRPGDAIAEAA
jgi:hypothetical protein